MAEQTEQNSRAKGSAHAQQGKDWPCWAVAVYVTSLGAGLARYI